MQERFPKIRVGTDDFKNLLLYSDVFVDKSLMIKALLEDNSEVMLLTRPRRWGKSLNLDMIRKFFEIEIDDKGKPLPLSEQGKLFLGGNIDLKLTTGRKKSLHPLKIASHSTIIEEYQGKFPVIHLTLKDVKGSNYRDIESSARINILRLYKQHTYLINSHSISQRDNKDFQSYLENDVDKTQLKDSLRLLSELLYKHFHQKVYILIDEYDTPINSSYIKFGHNREAFEEVLDLFRGILGSALKSNPYLEKGVITGILRIAKANLFSDLNNIAEYTLLDEAFSLFYGFSQLEVDELLTKIPTPTNPDKIKDWYNGYTFGGEVIYNPWSIMQCLARKGVLDYYWLDSGGTGLVDNILLTDRVQEDLQTLLEGRSIIKKLHKQIAFANLASDSTILYSLLLFTGYLNPTLAEDATEEDPRYRLTIPNKEVSHIYIERVIQWVTNRLNISVDHYDSLIKLLITGQIDTFQEQLQYYLLHATSYHDLSSERDYHNLMGGLLSPLANSYNIISNRETGYGRCDHILIPKAGHGAQAIILEYKLAKRSGVLLSTAQAGLAQIIAKQYHTQLKAYGHVKGLTKIAMAFYGKRVVLVYQLST